MTQTPRSSTKRLASAQAAKKLSNTAKKSSKPVKKRITRARKVREERKMPKPKLALPIQVARTKIDYDPRLYGAAGFLQIANGTPQLRPPNGDTLLHLLFFIIYTKEGSDLLRANGPASAATPDRARANLKQELLRRFPTIEDDRPDSVLDPIIDAHFAADWYVEALRANNTADQAEYQQQYSQALLVILGELHDDALKHEFSMLW
jgi:hypothetical protein